MQNDRIGNVTLAGEGVRQSSRTLTADDSCTLFGFKHAAAVVS